MNAVVYCRVSSKDQVEGTSLESQELACLDYARRHNFAVSKVFIEEGESAKFADRTQLLELLSYCKNRTLKIEALIVWKLDRFARNVEDHYTIKAALKKLGVQIVSVTEPIQADPNGKLMETILAGFAQFDNDIRALRSVQGMQQRLREGIWPWKPPLGYLSPKSGKKTQPDQPDPSCFKPIRKAWQMFATGAYTKADILRRLRKWGVCAYRGQLVTSQLLDHMFGNSYYAGLVRDPWSGEEYPGRHMAMVSAVEFARVQKIVSGRSNSQPHHRLTDSFPLRGQVRCPSCNAFMTGYFAKGRCRFYPYYKCFRRGCPTLTKSYASAAVHDEFSLFLTEISIPHYLASGMIIELVKVYSEETVQIREADARKEAESQRVKRQLQELISMRAARLVADEEFIAQRKHLKDKLLSLQATALNDSDEFLTDTETGGLSAVLSDIRSAWTTMPPEAKRTFGILLFPSGYVFQRLRHAEKGLLFKTFATYDGRVPDATPDVHLLSTRFEQSVRGTVNESQRFRTQSDPDPINTKMTFRYINTDVVPLVRENLNTIFAESRRLLAIVRPNDKTKKEAA